MSTALIQKLRYMARQYTAGSYARGGNPPTKHYLDEAADLLEQYHREAIAARCPDCGERNPADVHTCSPQKPASVEPVAWITHAKNGMLRSLLTTKTPDESLMPGDVQTPLYVAPQPDSGRVAELEAECERLHALWLTSACNAEILQFKLDQADRDCDEARAEVERLRKAIEAMRVAGGSSEFQAAFDRAKALATKGE